jgi:hypothetical protein
LFLRHPTWTPRSAWSHAFAVAPGTPTNPSAVTPGQSTAYSPKVALIRMFRLSLPLLATGALLGTTTAAGESVAPPLPGIHPIPTAVPTLRNAVALGTLVAIDPGAKVAEFRIKCGWYIDPKRKVHLGLWKVALRDLAFESESYPNGPASGISRAESLGSWERGAERKGWSGTLYLSPSSGFLTNGPTTDICAGVLG